MALRLSIERPSNIKMANFNTEVGRIGEEIAVLYLKKQGYRILERNYRSRLGEIDIIAKDKDVLCFIEVKTRRSDKFGLPFEAISFLKQQRMIRTAKDYIHHKKIKDTQIRFDVVSVEAEQWLKYVNVIKNAFEVENE